MPDFITNDVDNFWRAFDAAEGMRERDQVRIYEDLYLSRGSRGFRDFASQYLKDPEAFTRTVKDRDAFYRSIRFSMHRIREFEGEIRHFYRRFRRLYPPVSIPNVTCVIGTLSCHSERAESGILIGAELFGRTESTVSDELDRAELWALRPLAALPDAVIHELVHVQQRAGFGSEDSLLVGAVREGVAVLTAELVTRRRDDSVPHLFGRARESEVWQAFREGMREGDLDSWLGGATRTDGWPPRLGAFVGCQICRAYVARGRGTEAVNAMIETEDFEEIYRESGYQGRSEV